MNEEEVSAKGLEAYVNIIRRGKLSLIMPTSVAFVLAFIVGTLLPATYQSDAVILVEQQKISENFVSNLVDIYAAQQIQVINTRVLTVQTINELVQKFNLFGQAEAEEKMPRTEAADQFREQMNMELVSANVMDPRSGRPTEVTIAFRLSFQDSSPATAQQVANELATLFLQENSRTRADQAIKTEEFFVQEVRLLDEEIRVLEAEIADFKAANEGSLPELYNFNITSLERIERELSDTRYRIQDLEQRKIELSAQLTQLSPSAPVVLPTGEVVLSDLDRLRALESEYRRNSAIYSADHPDVVRIGRELSTLRDELGVGPDVEELRDQLWQEQQRLEDLRVRYTEDHQDIQDSLRLIEVLEADIARASSDQATSPTTTPDSPAYILLETQIATMTTEINALQNKLVDLEDRREDFETALQRAPHVEKDYQSMLRDYDNATRKYQEIRNKQREASVAKNLQQSPEGDRFTLIEPPPVPTEPVSPNRPLIIALGTIVGLGLGIGWLLLKSAVLGAINGPRELGSLMGVPPLVTVPYINNEDDVVSTEHVWRYLVIAGVTAVLLALVYIHFFFRPLDVIIFSLPNKLGLG